MRFLLAGRVAAALLAAVAAASGADALTVHTGQFMVNPERYNGFEGLPGGVSEAVPYTEMGITVSYVGRAALWSESQAAEGARSWYPNGGGFGYTRVTFGGAIDAVQFAAGSGWATGAPALQWQLLLGGELVAEGVIEGLPIFAGFRTYGFSESWFDEMRVQALNGPRDFNPGGFDGLVLDNIAVGGRMIAPGIPEPATWAMLIAGFGLIGAVARRRVPVAPQPVRVKARQARRTDSSRSRV
ncbi:MAG: PEPxxWA-CTERM sorting domain-containing protein [Sphingomonadaceae bacterium]